MLLTKHAALLVAFMAVGGHAQALFRGTAEPMTGITAAPMAASAPGAALDLGAATAPITSTPSVAPQVNVPAAGPAASPETTATIPATAPTAMVPGCPDGPNCPPEPEGDGPFTEAVKEMRKEFAKCEAEGKSLEACLSDQPQPPNLSQLTQEDRAQLVQCLGSSDLSATEVRWSGCSVGAD